MGAVTTKNGIFVKGTKVAKMVVQTWNFGW